MVIYNNINKNLHKNLTYNNFNTLYTKIFASKKNITPLSFNNYRLEYIINYKNNLHFSKKNNNIFLYPY